MTQYHEHHHHYHNYQQSIHASSLKVPEKITGKALDTGKAMCTIQIDYKSSDQINTITIPPPVKALDSTAMANCKSEDDTEENCKKQQLICKCIMLVILLMILGALLLTLFLGGTFNR